MGRGNKGKPRLKGPPVSITHPEVILQWNDENYKPEELSHGSEFKIKWKCEVCEHEWRTYLNQRIRCGDITGCPYCNAGRLHSDGRNSLSELFPNISKDFHPSLNGKDTARNLVSDSAKTVWWKCRDCKYEWRTRVSARTEKGNGCPACSNRKVKPDLSNSLAHSYPEIAKDLCSVKNGGITAEQLTKGSSKYVWWNCKKCEHEWFTMVSTRVRSGCPCCANIMIHSDGRNSLERTHPDIAEEWHPELNGELKPTDIKSRSGKKIWWKCKGCQHEWKCMCAHRTGDLATGCPACAGKAIHIDGRNSLSQLRPEIAEEWHPTNNGKLTPNDVTDGSGKYIWWECKICGHAWRNRLSHRTKDGIGCLACSNHEIHTDGRNSLTNTHPKMAKDWHPYKNKKITPNDVTAGSTKRIWWKCQECEKEWNAKLVTRTSKGGTGCPSCAPTGFDPSAPGVYYCMEIRGPDGVWWYKGGIAADPIDRTKRIQSSLNSINFPVDVHLVSVIQFDYGGDARRLETELLRIKNIRVKTKEKFDGSSELFSVNPVEYARENNLLDIGVTALAYEMA
jgi:hypothetical protein